MDLLSLYREGKTATEIGKIVGVSRQVITKRLRRLGVEIKQAKDYLTADIDENVLRDLYINQKRTAKEIGLMFGLHDQSITRKLKQYGIPQNSPYDPVWTERKKISKDELAELYVNQRKSIDTIAKQFNVQPRCIAKKLKRYGIETRRAIDYGLGTSSGEKQLAEFIDSITSSIIINDRKIIKPYELDIVIPRLKLAIEYNGTFYHADPRFYRHDYKLPFVKNRRRMNAADRWAYDAKKKALCEAAGYRLITVWEHDWTHNRPQVEETLRFLL